MQKIKIGHRANFRAKNKFFPQILFPVRAILRSINFRCADFNTDSADACILVMACVDCARACAKSKLHSRPQGSSLLRMTDSEKSSGEPWAKLFRYLLLVETKKALPYWSICDAVKFERALRRASRPLGNSISVFYANHISCTQS